MEIERNRAKVEVARSSRAWSTKFFRGRPTGRTSDFESENGGSNPSPEAKTIKNVKVKIKKWNDFCLFNSSRRGLTGKGDSLRNCRLRVRISPSGPTIIHPSPLILCKVRTWCKWPDILVLKMSSCEFESHRPYQNFLYARVMQTARHTCFKNKFLQVRLLPWVPILLGMKTKGRVVSFSN